MQVIDYAMLAYFAAFVAYAFHLFWFRTKKFETSTNPSLMVIKRVLFLKKNTSLLKNIKRP